MCLLQLKDAFLRTSKAHTFVVQFMIKLILLLLFFLLSLLVVFRAPASLLWYMAVLITEFSWIFILLVLAVLFWKVPAQYNLLSILFGIATLMFLLTPYWQAWQISRHLDKKVAAAFGTQPGNETPFKPLQILTGLFSQKVSYQTIRYDADRQLNLHFYPAAGKGLRPCIVVIHGGSWAGGNNLQLPELNSELARAGYHVASINYRLAPAYHFPAPVEDVQSAIGYLKENAAALSIDSNRFVLLGRSAGGQVALSAAYTLPEPAIKGVIDFYGPTDMVWGYENPTNPLVLDSKKIMEDYLGGTRQQVPQQYIRSSATATVTTKTPPTLMIYAGNDPLVSPRHGDKLSLKLEAMNIPHFLLHLPWATHGFDFTLNGPAGQLSTWTVKRFLEAILTERK
jgi:acetyl esterase/lipase